MESKSIPNVPTNKPTTTRKPPIASKGPGMRLVSCCGHNKKPLIQAATVDDPQLYCPDQLKFLERKRLVALGLAPPMPQDHLCPSCEGIGMLPCHACDGTGINQIDPTELFGEIVQENSQEKNMRWWFVKDGPCYLCRGKQALGCKDCVGTGYTHGFQHLMGD